MRKKHLKKRYRFLFMSLIILGFYVFFSSNLKINNILIETNHQEDSIPFVDNLSTMEKLKILSKQDRRITSWKNNCYK